MKLIIVPRFQVDLVGKYRQQCQELNNQLNELQLRVETLQFENMRVEKANEILLETVKVAQTQKDLCCDELERMKNAQRTEFDKYKKLLAEKDSIALEYDRAIQYANDGDERCSNAWAAYRDLKNEMEKLSVRLLYPLFLFEQCCILTLFHSNLSKSFCTVRLSPLELGSCPFHSYHQNNGI